MNNMTPERNEFLVLVNVKKHNTLVKAGETDHLNPFKHQNVKALRQSKSYGCSKKVREFFFLQRSGGPRCSTEHCRTYAAISYLMSPNRA